MDPDLEKNIMGGYHGHLRDAEENGILPVFRFCVMWNSGENQI